MSNQFPSFNTRLGRYMPEKTIPTSRNPSENHADRFPQAYKMHLTSGYLNGGQ